MKAFQTEQRRKRAAGQLNFWIMRCTPEIDYSTAPHLHSRTPPSVTASPPAHSQGTFLLGTMPMPPSAAANLLAQSTPQEGHRGRRPRVISIDGDSDNNGSSANNTWVHEGPVSADEWAEIPDNVFDDPGPQAFPDLAAGMATVSIDNGGCLTSQASAGHSDWAQVAEELVGDPFEDARQVAIRRAPVQLEPGPEGTVEKRKVAYVVYHGRDRGVFYNW